MDAVDQATQNVTKAYCTELKNFPKPPSSVEQVIVSVANFVEGREGSTFISAKGKLFDYIRRGVGARDLVSAEAMAILRNFAESGITEEALRPKSKAAATLATYLTAML